MWELRYQNSCLVQLVSCKSLESPQIQQGYWLWWKLRYSRWKQLCLGILTWTESSIWEGIMWIFCQRNPKLNRRWWDFFFCFPLHFSWVCMVGKITLFNSEHTANLFKKTFSAVSLENQIINQWEKQHIVVIIRTCYFIFLFAILNDICNFESLKSCFLLSKS